MLAPIRILLTDRIEAPEKHVYTLTVGGLPFGVSSILLNEEKVFIENKTRYTVELLSRFKHLANDEMLHLICVEMEILTQNFYENEQL